jgi:exodeoxyribonuclease X
MVVRVIDIETTGTDPEQDAVIEIASVDVLADGTIANRQSTLVRPGIPVPPEASAVHHLIDEDLAGAPPTPATRATPTTSGSATPRITPTLSPAPRPASTRRRWRTPTSATASSPTP